MTRMAGILHEDEYIYIYISTPCSIIFRMRNVSDEICRENQNTIFLITFFKNGAVLRESKKYCTDEEATDYKIEHAPCMLYT